MKDLLKSYINNKRVAILGFGREGKSTLKELVKVGGYEKIDILDLNEVKKTDIEETLAAAADKFGEGNGEKPQTYEEILSKIDMVCGKSYQKELDSYDIVIKSPGIVLEKDISQYKTLITSQTEIFFEYYKSNIIGITGTKGKSTTTTLVYHILKNAGYDTVLGGNIGIPAFDIVENINKDTIIVFEMSSHMLEFMKTSPHIGVLMNIHEEHLDHYGTMEKYVQAKENIVKNQSKDDICFVNRDIVVEGKGKIIPIISKLADESNSKAIVNDTLIITNNKIEFILNGKRYNYEIPTEDIKLVGEHNYFDIAVAYGVLKLFGVEDEAFNNGLKGYEPLPHRLQLIGEVNGVKYYDDSISTICDTTINALNSVKDADTVLIGGMDRGIDYSELIEYLSKSSVNNIILMYETGRRIYGEIKEKYPDFEGIERIISVADLEAAVKVAGEVTRTGRSCILSPAAASYGYFKNFEERGNRFLELVKLHKK